MQNQIGTVLQKVGALANESLLTLKPKFSFLFFSRIFSALGELRA